MKKNKSSSVSTKSSKTNSNRTNNTTNIIADSREKQSIQNEYLPRKTAEMNAIIAGRGERGARLLARNKVRDAKEKARKLEVADDTVISQQQQRQKIDTKKKKILLLEEQEMSKMSRLMERYGIPEQILRLKETLSCQVSAHETLVKTLRQTNRDLRRSVNNLKWKIEQTEFIDV